MISEVVNSIKLIDTHEHLEPEPDRLSRPQDPMFLFLAHYLTTDFFSSGMTPEEFMALRDLKKPWEERWPIFERYWDYAKTTGYGLAIRLAIRDLYGISDITRDTYPKLVESMNNKATKGFYRWVLEKANIGKVVLDHGDNTGNSLPKFDRDLFTGVIRFEGIVFISNWGDLMNASRRLKVPIHHLSDLENAFRRYIREVLPNFIGVKTSFPAYMQSLKFEYVTPNEAEYALKAIIEGKEGFRRYTPSSSEVKPLQDYLFRVMLDELEALGKPLQVHTGIQETAPTYDEPPNNALTNANPTQLINLFKEYQNVKFILFHASYPYYHEAGVLAKQWPNVYLDLCWMHEINPRAYADILSEWLELVPNNKIMAFGGDYIFIEGTYGASVIAKRAINEVVEEKINKGHWDKEDADKVIKRILKENAERVFKLT
ncbi:MAG: amidohydrolase family protein [Caldivirga sp.]|uniref:amidohydrolase family protein n=1 Tax=Caldivirga sp. TaxID=2080243 RepID=UPI003D0BE47D